MTARRKTKKKRRPDLPLISPQRLDTDDIEFIFPESHLHVREV